jgi:putative DNA primase/helicase
MGKNYLQNKNEKIADRINYESAYLRTTKLKRGLARRTDTTNAERLIREAGAEIRYNAVWKKWLVWNGKYWNLDEGDIEIHERGITMVRNIYDDVLETSDYLERVEIEKFAMQSESMRRRKAFVEAATKITGIKITPDELDTNPWLLNVQNGTVDVVTGEFREHRKDDYITKIANVDYDPAADCPVWKNFVREIMNFNADTIKFLQTAAGWGITGSTSEQTMFILFGSGANGKSTFLNTILNLLGDYATSTQTETFTKQNGDRISSDIARLRGTRFVTTTETEQGKRLSEPLIKQITGSDKLTAERSGILNRLIEGSMRWKRERLLAPECVTTATNEYRGEMDVIGNFIKERCVQNPAG